MDMPTTHAAERAAREAFIEDHVPISDTTSDGLATVRPAPASPAVTVVDRPDGYTLSQAAAKASAETFTCSAAVDQLFPGLLAAQKQYLEIERILRADVQSRREGARSYSYNYAPLSEVLRAVRPALNEAGILLLQPPVARGSSAMVTTLLVHAASGQWMRNDCGLTLGASLDPQAFGSAVHYLRRYVLMSMLGVSPEDREDNDAASAMPSRDGNGNGHSNGQSAKPVTNGSTPMPTRASSTPQAARPTPPPTPAPPQAVQAPAPTVVSLSTRNTTGGTPYWTLELSDGRRELVTFDRKVADQAEVWRAGRRPVLLRTHPETSKSGVEWTFIDAIRAQEGARS